MANETVTPSDIVRQAIVDGELVTTKPVNRALLALLDENERLADALIEAQNPGIDMAEVRRSREGRRGT